MAQAGAFLAAGSAISGFISKQKESRERKKGLEQQRRANQLARRAELVKERREKALAIEESRVQRGNILAAGAASGARGSSATLGAAGGLQSSIAANIGISGQIGGIRSEQSAALDRAAGFESNAIRFGNLASGFGQLGQFARTPQFGQLAGSFARRAGGRFGR